MNRRRTGLPGLLGLVLAAPLLASAGSPGIALVIGVDPPAVPHATSACAVAAGTLRDRLRADGFTVEALTDPSSVEMRTAIDDFAAQLDGSPSGSATVYICTAAVTDGTRLFVLPSGVDPAAVTQPQTEGVVVQALLNALAGTGGTLYLDLDLPAGAEVGSAIHVLGEHLPPGLHAALTTSGHAPLGHRLAVAAATVGAGWNAVASDLADKGSSGAGQIYLMSSPPPPETAPHPAGPMPPSATAVPPSNPSPTPSTPPVPAPAPPSSVSMPKSASPKPAEHERRRPAATAARRHAPAAPAKVTNPRIARLQSALARLGYFSGAADGVLDARTLAAIRAFQHALGDPPTGTMTQVEIVRLLNS